MPVIPACYQCREVSEMYNSGKLVMPSDASWAYTCPVCGATQGVMQPATRRFPLKKLS